MSVFSLLFFLITAMPWAAAGAPAEIVVPTKNRNLVSEAVAQVSDHVITSREVISSHIVDQALAETLQKKAEVDRSGWVLKIGSEDFQKHLAQVVLECVVQLEAENFSIGQINLAETQSFEKHVEEMVGGWEPWGKLEMSKVELDQMVSRKLR